MTKMDTHGQDKADNIVNSIEPEGMTNLWDGLRVGLEQFTMKDKRPGVLSTIYLLTDGCPNVSPPRGEDVTLKLIKEKHDLFPEINMFGFGYDLDSKLLYKLATIGNGQYYFIPDSSFVGTIFIHSLTKSFTTHSININISIKGPQINVESFDVNYHDGINSIMIGSLQYSQSRNITFECAEKANLEYNIDYNNLIQWKSNDKESIQTISKSIFSNNNNYDETCQQIEYHRVRLHLSDELKIYIFGVKNNKPLMLYNKQYEKNKLLDGIMKDILGQINEAMKPEYYERWGRHYILSLSQAYQLENCNNFKDPGVQMYIGELGEHVRDVLDSIFLTIPAPSPRNGTNVPISMNTFHNSSNPCFTGESLIKLSNGDKIPINTLKKGDRLYNRYEINTVKCVLVTRVTECEMLIANSELTITKYHPIFNLNRTWVFPIDLFNETTKYTGDIYSIVLERVDSYTTERIKFDDHTINFSIVDY
jgi:hypothetical protein